MITQNRVVITQNEKRVSSSLVCAIHLWHPQSNTYNTSQIQEKDAEYNALEFLSGEDFQIQRKLLEIDKENEYSTFVYL